MRRNNLDIHISSFAVNQFVLYLVIVSTAIGFISERVISLMIFSIFSIIYSSVRDEIERRFDPTCFSW